MISIRPISGFRNRVFFLGVAIAACSTAVDTRAGDDTGWRLRVDFGYYDSTGGGITIENGDTFRADLEGGAGIGLRSEYQWSLWLGVEFGFFSGANVDISIGSSNSSSLEVSTFVPYTVGLDVHLTPGTRVDLYLGPQVAWVSYSGITARYGSGSSEVDLSVDTQAGPAAILGLDILMGARKKWMFQLNVRYFDTSIESDTSAGRVEGDFDPPVYSLGFGYRF